MANYAAAGLASKAAVAAENAAVAAGLAAASAAQAAAEAAWAAQAGAAAQQQVPQRQVTARWCVRWVNLEYSGSLEFWSQGWPRDPSGRPGLPPECCDRPDIVTGRAGTGEA